MSKSKKVILKSCPFCKHKVQIFSLPRADFPFNSKKDKWYAQCRGCGCNLVGRTRKYNLIKAWNRRVNE